MNEKKFIRRNILIINPPFQIRFISIFFIISLMISFSIIFFAWNEYRDFKQCLSKDAKEMSLYTELIKEYIDPALTVYYLPPQREKIIFIRLCLFSVCLSLAVMLIGIIMSHRIAGPLHRMNSYFIAIANGKETPPLKFRYKDEFLNIAESFNLCIDHLKAGISAKKTAEESFIHELTAVINEIKDEQIKKDLIKKIEDFKLQAK